MLKFLRVIISKTYIPTHAQFLHVFRQSQNPDVMAGIRRIRVLIDRHFWDGDGGGVTYVIFDTSDLLSTCVLVARTS